MADELSGIVLYSSLDYVLSGLEPQLYKYTAIPLLQVKEQIEYAPLSF